MTIGIDYKINGKNWKTIETLLRCIVVSCINEKHKFTYQYTARKAKKGSNQ